MLKTFLYRMLCGFFLGLAVIAPGLSGGVIAIIMGIYQDLLRIIANPFKDFKKNVVYLVPMAIGAGISVVVFVFVLGFLFETYEKYAFLLFVGLVAGNLPVLFGEIKKHVFKKQYAIGGVVAFALVVVIGTFAFGEGQSAGADAGWLLLACSGIAAGVASIIPGMSVSTTLIIMGVYSQLIFMAKSILGFDFTNLGRFAVFGVCAVLALILAASQIKKLFEKHPGLSNTTVFGFMTGSFISILIHSLRIESAGFNWYIGVIALLAGLGVSFMFVKLADKFGVSA